MQRDPFPLPAGLPVPLDDGAAAHLPGATLPPLALPSTNGGTVALAQLAGWWVLYLYRKRQRGCILCRPAKAGKLGG